MYRYVYAYMLIIFIITVFASIINTGSNVNKWNMYNRWLWALGVIFWPVSTICFICYSIGALFWRFVKIIRWLFGGNF